MSDCSPSLQDALETNGPVTVELRPATIECLASFWEYRQKAWEAHHPGRSAPTGYGPGRALATVIWLAVGDAEKAALRDLEIAWERDEATEA